MKDVARLACVSTSTVSHVINQNRYVSEAVTAKVLQAIQQLNYAPSALARSLKMKQTKTIGMLVTTSNNPFFAEVVRGVERSCYERGYSLILCNTEGDIERLRHGFDTLLQKRVDGLLVMCSENHQVGEKVQQRYPTIPIVMMDWAPSLMNSDVIQDNALLGGEMATRYLIEQGYQRIACISGPVNRLPAQGRVAGYRTAMQKVGLVIPQDYIVAGDFEFESGVSAMEQLLALKNPPEAVFAGNDAMALGVYHALYLAGLQVGKDMAVMGYDDIELARYLSPPLTTIHQPKDELGQLAIDQLLQRLANPNTEPQVLTLTPKLIERASVWRVK